MELSLSNIPHLHNSWALESEGSPVLPESSPPNSTAQAPLGQMEILHIGRCFVKLGPVDSDVQTEKSRCGRISTAKKIRCFSDLFRIRFGSDFDPIRIRFQKRDPIQIRFGSDSDPIWIRFGSDSKNRIRFGSVSDPIRISWPFELGHAKLRWFHGKSKGSEMFRAGCRPLRTRVDGCEACELWGAEHR